jgi:hypothetical protein
LGPKRFSGFVKFIAAMGSGNYAVAAAELIASKWYTQTGQRGPEIHDLIKSEKWPT